MDLHSIINLETDDSWSINQATSNSAVNLNSVENFKDHDFDLQYSSRRRLSQEFGAHRTESRLISNTYEQNHQIPPSTPFPIPALPPNHVRSPPTQFITTISPRQIIPASATSKFLLPPSQHAPHSPSQPYRYIIATQSQDSVQHPHSNPHHNNIYHDLLSPCSSQHHSFTRSTNISDQPCAQHKRSQSPTLISDRSKHTNPYSHSDLPSLETSDISLSHSLNSHHSGQKSQRSLPSTPLALSIPHRLTTENLPQPSKSDQELISSSSSHNKQVSPTCRSPDSIPLNPRCSTKKKYSHNLGCEQPPESYANIRDTNTNLSPKTHKLNPQKKSLSSDSLTGAKKIAPESLKTKATSNMEVLEMTSVTNQVVPKNTTSHLEGDTCPSTNTTQHALPKMLPRKRIRYTSPPIWAKSIRTHSLTSLAKQNSSLIEEKQHMAESNSTLTPQRVKSNEIWDSSTPDKPALIDNLPSTMLQNWEDSITGEKPIEHMTKLVADFLYRNLVSRNDLAELSANGVQIEVEAKLGELIDKDTNQRFFLPIQSECILADNLRVGFKSSMTEQQHRRLNEFLNNMVKNSHVNHASAKKRVKIEYLHRREVDSFYELPQAMQAALPSEIRGLIPPHHTSKVRVTRDQKSGQILAKIIKARVANLDIHSGITGDLDCRISINLEMPYEVDLDELVTTGKVSSQSPERSKDRLSYSQSYYQIDLTQVTQNKVNKVNKVNNMHNMHNVNNNMSRSEKEHELEIEISTEAIMYYGKRASGGNSNEYLPLVQGFLDNVRVLSRFAAEVR